MSSSSWFHRFNVAFAYGATLANLGRKSEAKEVLDSLDPRGMSIQEADWIRTALQ